MDELEDITLHQKVDKLSGKPFKSGLKSNTILDTDFHPITRRPTFYFHEDDSYVEQRMCHIFYEQ